ncbi:MAG: spore coat protein U domain-containing protein [Dechloromonas sp.]|nr:MAG: spore coat protein U domain-containing protein [Dechloromonas sp.]
MQPDFAIRDDRRCQNISICASIPASQYPAAGSYSDTVTMTLTY